ncbi:hypothetical protein BBP40_001067, partial [Aspergillus hancockii]
MVSCAILTPAEVIKQNAQVLNMNSNFSSSPNTTTPQQQQPSRGATIQVLSKFKHKPWKLWSGYTALVGRNLPFTGLHFPIFEAVRGELVSWREKNKRDVAKGKGRTSVVERAALTAVAAGISGTIASVVTTPIDVVKTRVMLRAGEERGR